MAYGILSFIAEMMISIFIVNGRLNISRMMTVVMYAVVVSLLGAVVIVAFRGRKSSKNNPELLDD
jgi:hypothetical protein